MPLAPFLTLGALGAILLVPRFAVPVLAVVKGHIW